MIYTSDLGQVMRAILMVMVGLCVYPVLGTWYMKKENEISFTISFVAGFFLYYVLFEIVALPLKILGASVRMLSIAWAGIILGTLILTLYARQKECKELFSGLKKSLKEKKKEWFWMLLLIGIEFLLIGLISPETMGVRDDSYYIADVTTSIFKDSIQQYSIGYQEKLTQYSQAYFLPMYPMHSAVMYEWLTLHPIVENKWVMRLMCLLVFHMVYYIILTRMLKIKDIYKILTVLVFMFYMNMNTCMGGSMTGSFFVFRLSEGKGILANIIIPALIWLFWYCMENTQNKNRWAMILTVIIGSYSIVMSSVFLIPILLAGLMGTQLLFYQRWDCIGRYLICMVPCICIMLFYELYACGIIMIPVC